MLATQHLECNLECDKVVVLGTKQNIHILLYTAAMET